MTGLPSDYVKFPNINVGGTPMAAGNKVGAQSAEPTTTMPGLSAVSMASNTGGQVNKGVLNVIDNKVGGTNEGK